ncbi:MAG TPA: M81 family metallopeptidase [Planctomycetota bacterium]|nr:M81 family metallopeptidase [Planctomycetota bacterium]
MRIAIGGIAIESCTFSPLPVRRDEFHVQLRGAELLARYPFLQTISQHQIEFVPTFFARSIPGGPVDPAAYDAFKGEFIERLAAAHATERIDGLYLELHGAMNVLNRFDAEGDWIESARKVVGPDCLISVSYDLHGNLSAKQLENLNMLAAYRTAPHVDVEATREKAMRMLIHCLKKKLRPHRAWVSLPVALPGEKTSTEWEPGQSLYAELAKSDPAPGVLDASIFIGYAWADEPRTGASVVVTGTDRETTAREASRVAEYFRAVHAQFDFGVQTGSIDECIRIAMSAPEPCVFISDSGDNPTAGGVGDSPLFLRRLIELNAGPALVAGLADAPATDACIAGGVGTELELSLGATLAPSMNEPLRVRAKVLTLDTTADRQAAIQIGNVAVILSHKRRPYHHAADMRKLGCDPLAYKIVVIKIGYLEPDLKRHAPRALLALSPGAVDQAIERLPFKNIRRPMYPLEREAMMHEPNVVLFG